MLPYIAITLTTEKEFYYFRQTFTRCRTNLLERTWQVSVSNCEYHVSCVLMMTHATDQKFSSTSPRRNPHRSPRRRNPTVTGYVEFVFEENAGREGNHVIVVTSSFFKCFHYARKRTADVVKFLQFKDHSRKDPFS